MTAPSNSGPLRVPCPHCQAPASTPCSSRTGKKADTHDGRWHAYAAARLRTAHVIPPAVR